MILSAMQKSCDRLQESQVLSHAGQNPALLSPHKLVVSTSCLDVIENKICIEWQTKIRHKNLSHCLQDAQTEGIKDGITRHREECNQIFLT